TGRTGQRRRSDHHRRHQQRQRRTAPDAGGFPRAPRPAVRLLHAGHGDDGNRSGAERPCPQRGRYPGAVERQLLPLHRLPQHRQGGAGRRSPDEGAAGMNETGIGKSVKRREDERFLRGQGRYTDDIRFHGETYAYFLRSPHAHARIRGIDTSTALASPSVPAAVPGECLKADQVGSLPCGWLITDVDGNPMREPPHPPLAQDKVRYVGDHVAVVIAESYLQAKDAAELIEVDYEELPAVAATERALAADAPKVHDEFDDNCCYVWAIGDKAETDAAFERAHHVTRLDLVNNRLIPNAIEPRAAIALYSPGEDRYTLYTTSQNPHVIRLLMCAFVLGLPEHKVRVVAPDVGG